MGRFRSTKLSLFTDLLQPDAAEVNKQTSPSFENGAMFKCEIVCFVLALIIPPLSFGLSLQRERDYLDLDLDKDLELCD